MTTESEEESEKECYRVLNRFWPYRLIIFGLKVMEWELTVRSPYLGRFDAALEVHCLSKGQTGRSFANCLGLRASWEDLSLVLGV